jgi:hypothetical protein
LVGLIVSVSLFVGDVSASELILLDQRVAAFEQHQRGVLQGSKQVQPVLRVIRLGGDSQRELLRGQVPLLPRLVLQSFLKMLLARFTAAESHARQQQANGHGKSQVFAENFVVALQRRSR